MVLPQPIGKDIQYHSGHQRLLWKIIFITTDNKNGVIAGIDYDGACGWLIEEAINNMSENSKSD